MSPHDLASITAGKGAAAIIEAQKAYAAKAEQVREDSRWKAQNIAKPGPAERMVSYRELYSEKAQTALRQEREKQIAQEKDITSGKVKTPIDKTVSRLPEKSSGPDR